METDNNKNSVDGFNHEFDRSKDDNHMFHSFRDVLVTTIKWIQMSNSFTSFFYSDDVFKVIQDKINDPQQASCIPFVLLSILTTDMQMLDEIHHPHSNVQYTFIFNLQQWLRSTIDKFTTICTSSSSIETIAIEAFDAIVNTLGLQNDDDEEGRLLDKLFIDDIEQDNDQFFVEVKMTMLSKWNQRKRLIERYVTTKWDKIIHYMQQQDHLRFYLVQNTEKYAQIFDQIRDNFQQLKSNTVSINQIVETICRTSIDNIDIYLVEKRDKQSGSTSKLLQSNEQKDCAPTEINDEYHGGIISEENESVQAYELFCKINEQMRKANFFDFHILFDEFY